MALVRNVEIKFAWAAFGAMMYEFNSESGSLAEMCAGAVAGLVFSQYLRKNFSIFGNGLSSLW